MTYEQYCHYKKSYHNIADHFQCVYIMYSPLKWMYLVLHGFEEL